MRGAVDIRQAELAGLLNRASEEIIIESRYSRIEERTVDVIQILLHEAYDALLQQKSVKDPVQTAWYCVLAAWHLMNERGLKFQGLDHLAQQPGLFNRH